MAIVIDFETNKAGECFILGYRHGTEFQQIILDTRLRGLTDHHPYRLRFMSPADAASMIIQKSKATNSPVAGYTTHDRFILERLTGPLSIEYVNIHTRAKKWINKYFYKEFRKNNSPPDWSLKNVATFINFPAERDYARGQTTSRINSVINGLATKKGMYSKLTQVQKTKATKLLKHNEFDVNAAYLLLQTDSSSSSNNESLDRINHERQRLEKLIDIWEKKKDGTSTRENIDSKASIPDTCSKLSTETANISSGTGEEERNTKPPRDLSKLRENHPTAYTRWSEEEETELKYLHQNEASFQEIAKKLGRQIGGIKSRLAKLGLIDHWE